jgi:hypothetical protein
LNVNCSWNVWVASLGVNRNSGSMRVLAPLFRVFLVVSVPVLAVAACEKVQMPHEIPGPPGSGLRDPAKVGPTQLSVAQQMAMKNHGYPSELIDNDKGGKTWVFRRATGGQFGEKDVAELLEFDSRGLLISTKTEVFKNVGK